MKSRILVIGDAIADCYVEGRVNRISPEAPVPVLLNHGSDQLCPGGALNVAANAASLGAEVTMVAAVGDDAEGQTVRSILEAQGIDVTGLISRPSLCTITKTRFVSEGHHVVRVDRESGAAHYANHQESIVEAARGALRDASFQIILLSDYGKGSIGPGVLQLLAAAAQESGVRTLVDARGRDVGRYRGLWGLKANRAEAEALLGRVLADGTAVAEGALELYGLGYEAVWITLGAEGSLSMHAGEARRHSSRARTVYDVTGAGDTFLAALGVALAEGQAVAWATDFANAASGLAIETAGTTVVRRHDLERRERHNPRRDPWPTRLLDVERAAEEAQRYRERHLRIGFTNGCFDLLHPGHIDSLEWAAQRVDVLFLGLNTDETVRRQKGPDRPILDFRQRAQLLLALRAVDYVVPFAEETPEALIRRLRPDALFKGEDWAHFVAGHEFVESYGGEVQLIPLTPGLSTTYLVERLRGRRRAQRARLRD